MRCSPGRSTGPGDRLGAYEVNRAVFDRLRGIDTGVTDDLAALYQDGLHPVLLNAYARALGLRRADYKALLAGIDADRGGRQPTAPKPRWRS